MSAIIKVRHRAIGFHRWPEPSERRDYLGHRHRHEFLFEACAVVTHDERQIEFHDLKDSLALLTTDVPGGGTEWGGMSCESIARHVLDNLNSEFGGAVLWVEVWEDGECGARVDA